MEPYDCWPAYCIASATACSQRDTADAPGSAVLCNASSGTYDDRPAPAFILFVISAPSDAADAANNRAEATDPAEHRAKLSRRSNTCLVGETEQAWQFC